MEIKIRQAGRGFGSIPLLFLLAGGYGLLDALRPLPGLTWDAGSVYAAAAALSALLWLAGARSAACFLGAFAAAAGCCGLAIWRFWPELGGQLALLMRGLLGTPEDAAAPADVTQAMLLLAALLSLLLVLFAVWMKSSLPLHLLSALLLLAGPLAGLHPRPHTIALLSLSQCACFASLHAGRRWGGLALQGPKRRRALGAGGAAAALLALLALGIAAPLAMRGETRAFAAVYRAEGEVQRALRRRTGTAGQLSSSGQVSRGNRYPSAAVQLELETNRQPTEPLYLRTFAGTDYADGSWSRADESDMIYTAHDLLLERYGSQSASSQFASLYYSMPFLLNELTPGNAATVARQLSVRPHDSGTGRFAIPYFSRWSGGLYGDGAAYSFLYYEPGEMHPKWEYDAVVPLVCLFRDAAQRLYTSVPEERLPRLAALCADNPQEGIDGVGAFILQTLHSRASYTATPGLFPLNEDVVEYFLFEGGRGYCVHFAAAAALMYRLYGVPARYASGYRAEPSDFAGQPDGTWRASLTGEAAHAWVELYLEGLGWTPVEVTPAAPERELTPEQAGILDDAPDSGGLPAVLEGMEGETGAVSPAAPEDSPQPEAAQDGDTPSAPAGGRRWPALLLIAAALGCLLWLVRYQRKFRLERARRGGCRMVFGRLLAMLRFTDALCGCDGGEPDFAARLSAAAPEISQAEARRLTMAVAQAAYGAAPPPADEQAFVWSLYCRAAAAQDVRLSAPRRLVFRYGKAFL